MAIPYAPTAIKTAIAELLEGTIGARRPLDSGIFVRGDFIEKSLEEKQDAALRNTTARNLFQVELGRATQNGAGPISSNGNRDVWDKRVTIYVLTRTADVVELQDRDEVIEQLEQDLWAAAQALFTSSNLLRTAGGVETGISSGMLSGPNGAGTRLEWGVTSESWELQLLEAQINALVTLDVTLGT